MISAAMEKSIQGMMSEGWGEVAITDSCSEATLAARLDLEEGSRVDFWEKNPGGGNS